MRGLLSARRNFNPSLLALSGGGFLFAYRMEPHQADLSVLALAVLDDALQVQGNYRLDAPGLAGPGMSFEDPRLFEHQGRPWVAFTVARYAGSGWWTRQAYGPLLRAGKGWKLGEVLFPRYGVNDGTSKEKNWTFFSAQGQIRCIYDMGIARWIVLGLDGEQVVHTWTDAPLQWPYGRLSGGTSPIPWQGELLTVFHSFTVHPTRQRVYYAGALTFEALAPHRPKLATPEPVLMAREEWGRPESTSWAPLCVFPGGLARRGDELLVAYGRNDLDSVIEPLELGAMTPVQERRGWQNETLLRLTRKVRVFGRHGAPGQVVSVPRGAARLLINNRQAEAA